MQERRLHIRRVQARKALFPETPAPPPADTAPKSEFIFSSLATKQEQTSNLLEEQAQAAEAEGSRTAERIVIQVSLLPVLGLPATTSYLARSIARPYVAASPPSVPAVVRSPQSPAEFHNPVNRSPRAPPGRRPPPLAQESFFFFRDNQAFGGFTIKVNTTRISSSRLPTAISTVSMLLLYPAAKRWSPSAPLALIGSSAPYRPLPPIQPNAVHSSKHLRFPEGDHI